MTGLYSPINKLMEQVTRPKGTGAEYMTELAKKPGYKPAEAEDRDLQMLMALPQMQRAEFMEKLKAQANKFPLKMRELTGRQTHHESYTLPGGENYREILLHTPMTEGEGFPGVEHHFGGARNVLASIRVKDRMTPEGKKILHLEEIQSDWHQQGRERGYGDANLQKQMAEIKAQRRRLDADYWKQAAELKDDPQAYLRLAPTKEKMAELTKQLERLEEDKEHVVPYGPHAKDWHELALKAMIQHAAENGYDQIAVTPGAEQARRYSLSKQVGAVSYNPETQHFQAFKPNRETITDEKDATPERVKALIGKEAAEKLLQTSPFMGHHYLEGEGLDIGGEGMKGFYDKMVPTFLNKFGKKHGVQVQPGTVPIVSTPAQHHGMTEDQFQAQPPDEQQHMVRQHAYAYQGAKTEAPVHTFDITPQMRDDVVKNGIPRYAEGGAVKEDVPRETTKAYKLFRVHPKHPGKLFPLFVDSNTPVEMNKWIAAKEGEMANGKVKSKIGPLAYRPGWHAGDLPIATHIGEKSDPSLTAPDVRPENHAWAEVEMPNDVDWQSEATKRGTNAQGKLIPVKAHITDQLPAGGHYRYKTNPNMTGNWLIGGSMKVNRVLSDKEVAKINKAAGMADLPRAQPFNAKKFGFAKGGSVGPEEFMAEEHVNYKAAGGDVSRGTNLAKFLKGNHPDVPKVVKHATTADFSIFDIDKSSPSNRLGPGFYTANDTGTGTSYSSGEGGNIMPLHISLKNPIVGSELTPEQIQNFYSQIKTKKFSNGFDATEAHKDIMERALENPTRAFSTLLSNAHYFDKNDWVNGMKATGHDGIIGNRNGKPEYVVFDNKQLKSAIGNRGTYDTNEPDINKAAGGVVKEKVTISPNMDVMQYELLTKKVK
jgi:hypothetical protein